MLRIGDPAGIVVGQRSERRIQRAHATAPLRKFPDSTFRMAGVIRSYDIFCCGLTDTTGHCDRREKSLFGCAVKRGRSVYELLRG